MPYIGCRVTKAQKALGAMLSTVSELDSVAETVPVTSCQSLDQRPVAGTTWILIALLAALFGCSAPKTVPFSDESLIVSGDPRFDVFEFYGADGSQSLADPDGSVMLSFLSESAGYCRVAWIYADRQSVLACRDERGWRIEAANEIVPGTRAMALGIDSSTGDADTSASGNGSTTRNVEDAMSALNPEGRFLKTHEIIQAASKGWR